jgi:hypothetical protein
LLQYCLILVFIYFTSIFLTHASLLFRTALFVLQTGCIIVTTLFALLLTPFSTLDQRVTCYIYFSFFLDSLRANMWALIKAYIISFNSFVRNV